MIFKTTLYFEGNITYEIEAKDDEHAEDIATNQLHDLCSDANVLDVIDAVVIKSDNQYTGLQESIDDDRRHEDRK
jgi:hypothetical protein